MSHALTISVIVAAVIVSVAALFIAIVAVAIGELEVALNLSLAFLAFGGLMAIFARRNWRPERRMSEVRR